MVRPLMFGDIEIGKDCILILEKRRVKKISDIFAEDGRETIHVSQFELVEECYEEKDRFSGFSRRGRYDDF